MLNLGLIIFTIALCTPVFAERIHFIHLARNYSLYVPNSDSGKNLPLLVLLHGCRQNPSLFLEGTDLEAEAEKKKFIILTPEQPRHANFKQCWNWFLNFQQQRHMANEMGQIVSATEIIANRFQVNRSRIFVAGLSAGGTMAQSLVVCYPDVFSGGAVHSGPNFKTAETIVEAETVLTSHEQKTPDYLGKKMALCAQGVRNHRLNKVLIIHGEDDHIVPPFHADLITDTQAAWRDFLDDGERNDSVTGQPAVSSYQQGNYKVTRTDIHYPGLIERKLMIKGMGHAWGGGKALSQFFDPYAPSSNQFIIDFFDLNK
jgi:poly(hydroxyalkanoate) depolymerase family esterase